MTTSPAGALSRQAASGLMWLGSGKVAYAAMQLAVLAVLARVLTPADFGVVSAALVVVAFSGILSHIGLGPALVQRAVLEPRHIRTAFCTSLALGLGLGVLLWFSAPVAARFFQSAQVEPVLRVLSIVFPLQGLGAMAESLARRELRFRWLAQLDIKAYTAGYAVVGVPLALSGWGVWALVAGQVVEAVARALLLLRTYAPAWGLPERQALRELMSFGVGFTIAKMANFLAVRGDNMVVGHFLGPSALGIYGRAYHLMTAPMATFGTVLDQVLFPTMARVQHDRGRIAAAYRRAVTFMALLVLPLGAGVVVLAPELVRVLLGERWGGVVAPLRVLALAMLFQNVSKVGDSLARAMGAVYRRAWRQVLYAALVLGGASLGQRWGVVGVAWGVLAAIALNSVSMAHLSLRLTGLTWSELIRAHHPGFVVATCCYVVGWVTAALLRTSGAGPLLVVVGTGAGLLLTVGSALLWARALGPDVAWAMAVLRAVVPGRRRAAALEPSG